MLDENERWWWTAFGLVLLTEVSRNVARGLNEETRYWLTVYKSMKRAWA